jgi:hypothetical protein
MCATCSPALSNSTQPNPTSPILYIIAGADLCWGWGCCPKVQLCPQNFFTTNSEVAAFVFSVYISVSSSLQQPERVGRFRRLIA